MKKIDTYVINLKSCPERKAYMEKELAPFSLLNPVFIEAVDGRAMTCAEQEKVFDQNTAYLRYGRFVGSGEVGCTLSHLVCYRRLVESGAPYALIVEDDLVIRESEHLERVLTALTKTMSVPEPTIIILNGDFWFLGTKPVIDDYRLGCVYDAVCAGAYLINVAAAQILLNIGAAHIADDWHLIKNQGITIFGSIPHLADQDRLNFQTTIAFENTGKAFRSNMKPMARIRSYWNSVIKRILKSFHHFEYKNFRW